MRKLIPILSLALAGPALAGEPEQAAVKAREAAYYRAYIDADTAMFADIIGDGFRCQHPSGNTFT